MTDAQRNALLKISQQNELPFITEGMESSAVGYIVSEDALTRIAAALEAAETSAGSATETAAQLTTAQENMTAAQTQIQQLQGQLTAAQEANGTLQARVDELEADGSLTQTTRLNDQSLSKGKVPAHENPKSSINALADKLMGSPKVKTVSE